MYQANFEDLSFVNTTLSISKGMRRAILARYLHWHRRITLFAGTHLEQHRLTTV